MLKVKALKCNKGFFVYEDVTGSGNIFTQWNSGSNTNPLILKVKHNCCSEYNLRFTPNYTFNYNQEDCQSIVGTPFLRRFNFTVTGINVAEVSSVQLINVSNIVASARVDNNSLLFRVDVVGNDTVSSTLQMLITDIYGTVYTLTFSFVDNFTIPVTCQMTLISTTIARSICGYSYVSNANALANTDIGINYAGIVITSATIYGNNCANCTVTSLGDINILCPVIPDGIWNFNLNPLTTNLSTFTSVICSIFCAIIDRINKCNDYTALRLFNAIKLGESYAVSEGIGVLKCGYEYATYCNLYSMLLLNLTKPCAQSNQSPDCVDTTKTYNDCGCQ